MSLRQVGKYEVVSTLGRGSMGVVYKAKDPEIGRVVAIKTLRSVFMGDDESGQEAMKRFRQESRSAGRLRHPNIVTIFEAGRTESGSPYIVMEFIEGECMENTIATRCPLAPKEALHYLAQIASAIDYAHSENVIHRDIKPSNVIIDEFYRPHLLDFGVAKLSDTSLTPAGTVVGTPSYMSPEQIRGDTLDGATDRFALGVVAYELFTGKRPFPGKDFTTVVNNIIHKGPLTFTELDIDLPAQLEEVLNLAVSKDKTQRFSSSLEFVDKAANVFGLTVDGRGLLGGFHPSMIEATGMATNVSSESPSRPSTNDEPSTPSNATSAESLDEIDISDETIKTKRPQPSQLKSSEPEAKGGRSPLFGLLVLILLGGAAYLFYQNPAGQEVVRRVIDASKDQEVELKEEVEVVAGAIEEDEPEPTTSSRDPRLVFLSFEPAPVEELPEGASFEQALKEMSREQLSSLFIREGLSESQLRKVVAESGSRRGIDFTRLLAFIVSHENFRIRIEALKALGQGVHVRRPDGIMAIINRLEDADYLVRGFAAKTLGKMQGPIVLNALEERIKLEQNDTVKKILVLSIASVKKRTPESEMASGEEGNGL